MIAAPLGEMRLATQTLRHLAGIGQLDAASLLRALTLIDELADEIEVLIGVGGTRNEGVLRLPVMTLGDVAAEARRHARPSFAVIEGGRT